MLRPVNEIGSGIVASIPDIIFLVVLFLVIRFALRAIRVFFDAVGRGSVTLASFDPEWAQPTYKIIRVAMIAFGADRRVSVYPWIPLGRLQGRLDLSRGRPVAWIDVGDLQHHRRLHDDLPARVQGRRPSQDWQRRRRRDREASAGDASLLVQERRAHRPELSDPDVRSDQLQLASRGNGGSFCTRRSASATRRRGGRWKRC